MVAPKLQPFEILESVDPAGGLVLELRANGLRLAAARASAERLREAGVRGQSRDDVRRELASSLSDLRLAAELDRQVFGYWFGPDDEVPTTPIGCPTGAVLPPAGSALVDRDVVCLDLVPVYNHWTVLSERGQYTYRHTAGLLNGEVWWFVPVKEVAGGAWPVVFSVALVDSIRAGDIEARYGFEASTRARLDAAAIQLRLRRT